MEGKRKEKRKERRGLGKEEKEKVVK